MTISAAGRFAVAASEFITDAVAPTIRDWLKAAEADAIVLTGDRSIRPAAARCRRYAPASIEVLTLSGRDSPPGPYHIKGLDVGLESSAPLEVTRSSERPMVIVSDRLSLDVDRTALTTTLDGWSEYQEHLPAQPQESCIHLATGLPENYRRQWNGHRVFGAGVTADQTPTPLVTVTVFEDASVVRDAIDPDRLSIRALAGVGPQRATNLRRDGFDTRVALADAAPADLAKVDGIGKRTAHRISAAASAIAEDRVVRLGDRPYPSGDPIFVDIETDGLAPTTTWLIGVLVDGSTRTFTQTDQDRPGEAIAGFLDWVEQHGRDRPILAYNGERFDFPVLDRHVRLHCPDRVSIWTELARFDPYDWAVTERNAVLPGRTNRLSDVASALGFQSSNSVPSGELVARRYRAWASGDRPELDWAALEQYCLDDVRALETVHDALTGTNRLATDGQTMDGRTTDQARLSDW